ncbi:MAG TPA: HlyD family efflux transporter periplasmic adaptor subunit [Polyangiales bacterium]|nr:HlyD family efflux transporter periplasmic adaptor subunit [Polyangiales bacterium]
MRASAGERGLVILGVLPLIAAGIWLVLLREPPAAEAARASRVLANAPERAGVLNAPSFVGVVVAGRDAELGAELGGEVVRVFKEPGATVMEGEPLLQLAATSVLGAKKLAQAQAREDRSAIRSAELAAQSALDQVERMTQAEAAYSERDLRKARNEAASAAAEVERLKATAALHRATNGRELVRASKQLVRAPFDGVLSARYLDTGDFASPGQALAKVVDQSRFVRFALPAKEHAELRPGMHVQVLSAGSDVPLTATVVDVDPELDAAAAVGFARAALPEQPRMSPGTRIEVRLLPGAAP